MGSEIVRFKDVENLSEKEQLEFYKKHFEGSHCEFNDCGRELHINWVRFEGSNYCDDCFEHIYLTEQKQLAILQKQLDDFKENSKLLNTINYKDI